MCAPPPVPPWFFWPWDAPLVWVAPVLVALAVGSFLYVMRRTGRFSRVMYATWISVGLWSCMLWALLFAEGLALSAAAQAWSQRAFAIAGLPQCDPSHSTSVYEQSMTHFFYGLGLFLLAQVGMFCTALMNLIFAILRMVRRRELTWAW